jgi:hypothetical protein
MMSATLKSRLALVGLTFVVSAVGCGDEAPPAPRSLASPAGMAAARYCTVAGDDGSRIVAGDRCGEGAEFPDGTVTTVSLVANRERETVMVVSYASRFPRLEDLNLGVPGLTGIPVCEGPRTVEATPDGLLAVVLCDVTQEVSIISPPQRREVARFERGRFTSGVVVAPDEPVVAFVEPRDQRVVIERLGFTCEGASDEIDRTCEIEATMSPVEVVPVDGTPAGAVFGEGGVLYVTYADRAYASELLLSTAGDGATCPSGEAAPCEARRFGLRPECSDGLDNDGDGLVDQQDPQCFGPDGAESPEGMRGRLTQCTDGEDNDGDGLVDHDDADCAGPLDENEGGGVVAAHCENGVDDDGDGLVDGDDPECGVDGWPHEYPVPPVADGARECANGVDDDGDGFADSADPGCNGPDDDAETRAAPVCADGEDNDGDGLVDVDDPDCYGAAGDSENAVASDGFAGVSLSEGGRFLVVLDPPEHQALVIDLEAGALIDAGAGDPIHDGLGVPLSSTSAAADVVGYTIGLENEGDDGEVVSGLEQDIALVAQSNGSGLVLNLRLEFFAGQGDGREVGVDLPVRPRDNTGASATAFDFGCTIPDGYRERVADQRGNESRLRCEDEELPQLTSGDEPGVTLRQLERFNLGEDDTLITESVPADWELLDETWTLTYEGVIPGMNRNDGLVDAEIDGLLLSDGVNFCGRGVLPGDRLTIDRTSPALDLSASDCAAFRNTDLTWVVTFVRANAMHLATIDGAGFVEVLPTRDCFAQGFSYEVRPVDTWTVEGSVSGFLSDRTTLSGQCVAEGGDATRTGRLREGEPFAGTFFSTELVPGTVAYERGTALTFSVENNFTATGIAIGPSPVDVDLARVGDGRRVTVSDGGSNAVFVFDADSLTSITSIF